MEVTDNKWLRAVVYNVLISHVDVVHLLHATRLSYTPFWRRYIFLMDVGGSGWDLKRDTH
jgi:hypothetical protein